MKLISIRASTLVLAVMCLSARALASDWYVDAVNGNNANSGLSSTTAWRTITFATANTPSSLQTIHVAAGTYDAALREDLPSMMRPHGPVVGAGRTSTHMKLELRGPQGATSELFWTRGALAATPMNTTFGQFDLQPSLAHLYRTVTIGPIVPAVVQRSIPNAAWLIGQTFAFQALTDNAIAPAGKAYTNAVQFTILP